MIYVFICDKKKCWFIYDLGLELEGGFELKCFFLCVFDSFVGFYFCVININGVVCNLYCDYLW